LFKQYYFHIPAGPPACGFPCSFNNRKISRSHRDVCFKQSSCCTQCTERAVGGLTHFDDKGGKSREIPVRLDLEKIIFEYIDAAALRNARKDTPLFRTAYRKTCQLTENPLRVGDVCRMIKRRLKAAGLPVRLSPHSFRVTTITDLLEQGVPLEDVQRLAGHADPRTTRLYDQRDKKVTRNIVERISI
jgi:integrase/recombinase XerD